VFRAEKSPTSETRYFCFPNKFSENFSPAAFYIIQIRCFTQIKSNGNVFHLSTLLPGGVRDLSFKLITIHTNRRKDIMEKYVLFFGKI
jgi:hypothetical protein